MGRVDTGVSPGQEVPVAAAGFYRASTSFITIKFHLAAGGRAFFCVSSFLLLTIKAVGC